MRRFPAEWEDHQAILLCFPHNGNDWPGKYGAIQWAFIEFIKKVSWFEQVILLVAHRELEEKVRGMLLLAHVDLKKIDFVIGKSNRSWMRDSGPVIVKHEGRREALHFNFNGWAKYSNYRLDRKVPEIISEALGMPLTQVSYKGERVVLEGGAIDVNGQGTLVTTEECLLDPMVQIRNPGFSRGDYEAVFKEYLGITNVIWLKSGIAGDDTHGHVDDLCRFVNADTVVTVIDDDKGSPDYEVLQENYALLQKSSLENGKTPRIVTLPMPAGIYYDGVRLPASYANFLILNKAVLVPTFNDSQDRMALQVIAACFPGREIVGISAIDLIWGFGTLHCLSQQIPA